MRKTSRPRSRRPRRGTILIAAISGRALARAAADAGLDALVADFFADVDTQGIAAGCRKLPGALARGFQWTSLSRALDALADQAPSPLLGLVYGSGFEDRPEFLARIAERWSILGNDANTVASVKSPEQFFAVLDVLGVAHPDTATRQPNGAGWIAKRRGGAGGSHVVPSRLQKAAANVYFQKLIEGRAVSALFVANGCQSRVLGYSEQWTAPATGRLWRYGGAVRPAALPPTAEAAMAESITKVAKAFSLRGLASADFVVAGETPYLLEINPRPGATLDIFATAAEPLLGLHLDAVMDGKLARKPPSFDGAAASAIVYAPKRVIVPRNMAWPSWAADVPKPGERIDKQRPICTVRARAKTKGRAKRLVEAHTASLLAKIQKSSKGEELGQEERNERYAHHGTAEPQRPSRAVSARPHR